MEDEMILNQPSDRRLAGDTNDLPPGPPGAENDDEYNDKKKEEKSVGKESSSKSRRRSPSGSPPQSKRKSPSRGPRSPRGRRTPSPRRRFGRNRDYSPERRRFNDRGGGRMRRSPIRNRSRDRLNQRRNGRDRFRGGRSRSNSPPSRRRWSPKKKPSSPPVPPPGPQYGVPGPGMYADAYNAYGPYIPPQQYGPGEFVGAPPPAAFGAAYPPPPTWGVPAESYQQPNWVPQPEPLPPAAMQPQPVVQQTAPVQPPGTQPPPPTIGTDKKNDVNPTHDAVAQEAENQRDELKKQRTNYLKKTAGLKKELKVLKEQRKDLIGGDGSHSPTTKGFLDENERLQSQIQKKLSTIENVIDMLTGIIGADNLTKDDEVESPRKHAKKKRNVSSSSSSGDSSSSTSSSSSSSSSSSDSEDNSSPERLKTKAIESMKHKRDVKGKSVVKEKKVKDDVKKTDEKKINYVFYDPEMHWCKTCDAFPKTAKDFLTHLHTKEHSEHVDTMETPWHASMISDEYQLFEGAPTKRTPIRGLTFFVPATAWYCKLCSVWMGDLHCASLHLKSKTHSNKYNTFLEKNPHFEVDWLADRQRVLNEKKFAPPPPQITSISTTAGLDQKEVKSKSKHEDKEKSSKKRKKKSSDKKDKKKKKRSKKRKKPAVSSSSSSNESSSETDAKAAKNKLINAIPVSAVSTGTAAPSIRVQMRNLNQEKDLEMEMPGPAPPPPPTISEQPMQAAISALAGETNKRDDLISQWNLVQPVISDKEKKLFEQLKGKLKNKPPQKEEEEEKKRAEKVVEKLPPVVALVKANEKKSSMEIRDRVRSPVKRSADRNDKDKEKDKENEHGVNRRRSRSRPSRRSKSRSPSRGRRIRRSRSRGGGIRRSRSRGRRSPSRGRYSPRGYGRRRRSRSPRRRSRSHGRSRRRLSSSRSRSRSRSGSHRIEKPIIRQPEFRPRVPEISNVKKNKTKSNEEKEERKKPTSSSSVALQSNKKLPFIGRMPVFKKQSQNSENCEILDKKDGEDGDSTNELSTMMGPMPMVQDSYSHAGYEPSMMCEYDDLMPDPVQFVSLMGAPPPPPSQPPPPKYAEDEKDILPPGIDETESEFVPKPISDAPIPRKGPLPKDFEEALNIIFPGDKKPEDDSAATKSSGETQIITDEPVMQQSDLLKEGIHMMTVEETSLVGMDEASQMSMNEPLQFNKPSSAVATPTANNSGENSMDKSPPAMELVDEAVAAACISAIPPPPPPPSEKEEKQVAVVEKIDENRIETPERSIPLKELDINDFESNLHIDQPPSPTDSEKTRRQEELDDLAMLGIDADDMAAQCI